MTNIFILLVVFQLKHFIVDYPMQTEYHLGKFRDDWKFFWPLFNHCLNHALATWAICMWMGHKNYLVYTLLGLFNGTIHFFMDRIKAGKKYMGRWKPLTKDEWIQTKKDSQYFNLENSMPLIEQAEKKLNSNKYFWWSIGFDQMVHHLTDIACIYFIVR